MSLERDVIIENLPMLLSSAAIELVRDEMRMASLCAPLAPSVVPFTRNPLPIDQLNELVVVECSDVAASVKDALSRVDPSIPDRQKVAFANELLNQAVGNPDDPQDYTRVPSGQIDQITKIFSEGLKKITAIYKRIVGSYPSFEYVLDLRMGLIEVGKTMTVDFEDLLKHMGSLSQSIDFLKRIVLDQKAGNLKVAFEAREKAFRQDVEREYGLEISQVVSNAKLLRDDFNRITQSLGAQDSTLLLAPELIVHYFFTAETFTDPLGRAAGVIEGEREYPGEIGALYQQRLVRFLDVYKRTIVAMNALERTLLLLECRL